MEVVVDPDAEWIAQKFFEAYARLSPDFLGPDDRTWQDLTPGQQNLLRATFREMLARRVLIQDPESQP